MTGQNKVIHIVFATDDGYAQHAGVAITSLKHQQKSGLPVHVHLLDGGISATNIERLNQLKDEYLNLTIYGENIDEYANYLIMKPFTKAIYLRLSIEQVLPAEIDRVLYCDCDMIFLKPIDDLWNVDLGKNWLAAVLEGKDTANYLRTDLGIDLPGRYFNSGMLLIDLKAWRNHQVCQRVKDFIKSNWGKLKFPDQDGLNAILYKNWLPLDKRWNTFTFTVKNKTLADVCIAHFTAGFKPWHYLSLDIYKDDYLNFLSQTPWRDYQFPDKNFINWLRRIVVLNSPRPLIECVQFFTIRWREFLSLLRRKLGLLKVYRYGKH